MAQVDFIMYCPLLFWFIILLILFYVLNFMFFLPLIFNSLNVRVFYFNSLIFEILILFKFSNLINVFIKIFNVFILGVSGFLLNNFKLLKFNYLIKIQKHIINNRSINNIK